MAYRDLRDYVDELSRRGLLTIVDEKICKDTELVPLVRLQFRGLPEAERKAFWFRNVTDARGRAFDGSVVLGALGSSRAIYGAALSVEPDKIPDAWARAHGNHLKPRVVDRSVAPVKEIVRRAPELEGGVDRFPHLVSTPGFDPAPFITAGVWVTRDPETGSYNLGIYRGMIKAEDRIGCATDVPTQHLAIQWEKARRMKRPLEAAVFIGGPPALLLAAASKVPYGVDEYGLAGRAQRRGDRSGAGRNVRCACSGACGDRDRGAHPDRRAGARGAVRRSERLSRPAQDGEDFRDHRGHPPDAAGVSGDHQRVPAERKHGGAQSGIRRDLPQASARCLQHPVGEESGEPRGGELQHDVRDPARSPCAGPAVAGAARGGGVRSLARESVRRGGFGCRSQFHGWAVVGAVLFDAAASRCRDHPGQGSAARSFGVGGRRRLSQTGAARRRC